MPTWWLILSSLFFAIVAMLFVILCGMALQMIRLLKSIEPQVKGLVKQLGELSEQTKGLVKRVDGLTARIEGVADSARSTVDAVGGRARSLVGVAEGVALPAAKKLQAFAPYIAMGMTALKILGMLRDLKVSYQAVAPKKASAEKPSDKVS